MSFATLDQLNALTDEDASALLGQCCAEKTWQAHMNALRPFRDLSALFAAAEASFDQLQASSWLAAFAGHPRIGAIEQLEEAAADESRAEQAGVYGASRETLDELAKLNRAYEEKFGFRFLIFAAGMSAGELLSQLKRRSHNSPEREMEIAKEDLRRITRSRMEKLINP